MRVGSIMDEIIWENKFFGKSSVVLTCLIVITLLYYIYTGSNFGFIIEFVFLMILLNLSLIIKRLLFQIKTNESYFAIKRFVKWKKLAWSQLHGYNIVYQTLYLETDGYEILIPLDYLSDATKFVYYLKEHILQNRKKHI